MGNTYDKLYKEVPTYKLITPSIVSERLKVRGSLAKRALDEMAEKGLIKRVSAHRSQLIYTRMIKDEAGTRLRAESWSRRRRPSKRWARRPRRRQPRLRLLRPNRCL